MPNWPVMYKYDPNIGAFRLTSACFADARSKDVKMSFTLERDLLNAGFSHSDAVSKYPGFGLASLNVNLLRNELREKQRIVRDPQLEDAHHCLVIGNKTKGDRRKIAKNAEIIIDPQMNSDDK